MSERAAAGALRDRVRIERATVTPSAYNEPVESWAELTTVWARKIDVSAREARQASEINAAISSRFLVRYSTETAAITPKDRLIYKYVNYNITGIRETTVDGPHRFFEIDAVARADVIRITATVAITGAAAQDVSPVQVAAGTVAITGAAAQDVSPVQVAAGTVAITGAAAQDVSPVQVAAETVAITGAAAQDVSPVQVAAGTVAITGAAAQDVSPVQVAAGSLSSVFSPLDLDTALVEWWDARTSGDMTLGGGNAISAWAGRKAAYSLTQATGSLQPVWNAGGYTVFDAANDYLQFTLSSGVAAGQLWIETTHGWYKSGIGNYSAGTHRVASADLIQLIFIDTAIITAPQLASLTSYMSGTQCAFIYKTLYTTIYNRIDNTTNINYSITYYDSATSYSRDSSQGGETVNVVTLGGLSAPITVAMPIGISNDTALQRMYLYNNQLAGLIPSLAANTALQRMYLYNNQLAGLIPSLAANTALLEFLCSGNQLTGSIPSLAANTVLTYAEFYSNKLTGYTGGGVSNTLSYFNANTNLLTASAINTILADFVAAGALGGTLNLGGTGNAAPTGQGILDKATLIGLGWGVTTNT